MKPLQDQVAELIEELKACQEDWDWKTISAQGYLPPEPDVGMPSACAEDLEYQMTPDDFGAMTDIFSNVLMIEDLEFSSSPVVQMLVSEANSALKNVKFNGGDRVKLTFTKHPDRVFKISDLEYNIKNLRVVNNKIHFDFDFPDCVCIN